MRYVNFFLLFKECLYFLYTSLFLKLIQPSLALAEVALQSFVSLVLIMFGYLIAYVTATGMDDDIQCAILAAVCFDKVVASAQRAYT